MAQRNQLIMIAGDSRIRGMEFHLRKSLDNLRAFAIQIEVISVSGAGVRGVVEAVKTDSAAPRYDQIFLMAGVCDLMIRRSTKNLVPNFDTVDSLTTFMEESYREAQSDLLALSAKPVICDLLGIDIAAYNTRGRPFPYYQDIVNEGVPVVNSRINVINADIETMPRAPFFSSYVHKIRRGRMTHRYELALNDGLHFTEYFKQRVARSLARVILLN